MSACKHGEWSCVCPDCDRETVKQPECNHEWRHTKPSNFMLATERHCTRDGCKARQVAVVKWEDV